MATAIGAIGLGTSLAGGALSAYGAASSGEANAKAYNYRAQMSRLNAAINTQNSDWALQTGEKKLQSYGMQAAQRAGAIKTTQAASGLDIRSGTAKDVQDSQALLTKMDNKTIAENTGRQAYGYRVQANNDLLQAGLDDMSASNSRRAGKLSALGSIIGTASSVSSKWLQGKQAGLWGSDSDDSAIRLYGPDMTVTGYA